MDCSTFIADPGVVVEPCRGAGREPWTGDMGERMKEDSIDASQEQEKDRTEEDGTQRVGNKLVH